MACIKDNFEFIQNFMVYIFSSYDFVNYSLYLWEAESMSYLYFYIFYMNIISFIHPANWFQNPLIVSSVLTISFTKIF